MLEGHLCAVLAEDVGAALGSCAHLATLRRTGTGSFDVRDGLSLNDIEMLSEVERFARLLPVDVLLAAVPRLEIDDATACALHEGRRPITSLRKGIIVPMGRTLQLRRTGRGSPGRSCAPANDAGARRRALEGRRNEKGPATPALCCYEPISCGGGS